MNAELKKAEIIRLVSEIAERDGGVAPGQTKFVSQTGIKEHVWRGKFWRSWSDVLNEAGFVANSWTQALADDVIFEAVMQLTRRLGKFPTTTDLRFERAHNPSFPGQKTIARNRTMEELAADVRAYAEAQSDAAVAGFCAEYLAAIPAKETATPMPSVAPLGHVYMIRYGKDFKIGRTGSVNRRSREVQIELPDTTKLIHAILTDDPVGVEAYWHRRFQEFRGNGEWFRLPVGAVAAFKKWTKII
ncbi:GIY-YIG nuclease family protein [Rhizobium leguminosarum]|uniref:GIY-YIG nuclease family protein n=1 Tax=Rhizobium leguminosarum TaxID=384 RepID=UPI001C98932B|nr:GIY-YIG nuclease family protein [Rhizobium leguminosarum]MBY5815651.1 GIY-YIG nuclease family protein [Rhizobium leguminosarum]